MIGIINYGLGNIKAFANVYKNLSLDFKICETKNDLTGVTKIILPGVGAFDHAMEKLNNSGMREQLDDMVLNKKIPVVGICVGMQILALSSEEGVLPGLGWINGVVKRIDTTGLIYKPHLPHMGWNEVKKTKDNNLLVELNIHSRFYFLHSYYFYCNNDDDIIATVEYGQNFTCAVNHQNIYGVQFHPEKSHFNGIQLLKNFGNL